MDMEQAFLDDILAQPDDDALRLIYADWLEENAGADERRTRHAELIRLQVELARRCPGYQGSVVRRNGSASSTYWRPPDQDAVARESRARELSRQVFRPQAWPSCRSYDIHRGLPAGLHLPFSALPQVDAVLGHYPIQHLHFTRTRRQGTALGATPLLARLRSLTLGELLPGDLHPLVTSPYLANLSRLTLHNQAPDAIPAILRSPALPPVTVLSFSQTAWRPVPSGLWLQADVNWGLNDTAHAERLTSLPQLRHLRVLNLRPNHLRADSVRALARCSYLGNLEELELRCSVYDAALENLAAASWLGRLKVLRLDLVGTGCGRLLSVARRLSEECLERLELRGFKIPAGACRELRKKFGDRFVNRSPQAYASSSDSGL